MVEIQWSECDGWAEQAKPLAKHDSAVKRILHISVHCCCCWDTPPRRGTGPARRKRYTSSRGEEKEDAQMCPRGEAVGGRT